VVYVVLRGVVLQCRSPLTILLRVVSTFLVFLKFLLLSVVVVVVSVWFFYCFAWWCVTVLQSPLTNLAILYIGDWVCSGGRVGGGALRPR